MVLEVQSSKAYGKSAVSCTDIFWKQTAYGPWHNGILPSFSQILCETHFSGPVAQTQHTSGWGVPGVAYPKPWHSVGLPPGRSPPKGEVSVGVASGFPTSLSPLYKNDARPQRGWSPHLQGVGNHSLKPPHSSPLPRFTNRHLSTLLEGSTLVP